MMPFSSMSRRDVNSIRLPRVGGGGGGCTLAGGGTAVTGGGVGGGAGACGGSQSGGRSAGSGLGCCRARALPVTDSGAADRKRRKIRGDGRILIPNTDG